MKHTLVGALLLVGAVAGCSSGAPEFASSAQMIAALSDGITKCDGISMDEATQDDYGFGGWGPLVVGAQPFACDPDEDDLTVMLVPSAQDPRDILAHYCAYQYGEEGALPHQYGYEAAAEKRIKESTVPLLVGKNWVMRTLIHGEFPPSLDTAKVEDSLGARLSTVGQECSAFEPRDVEDLVNYQ